MNRENNWFYHLTPDKHSYKTILQALNSRIQMHSFKGISKTFSICEPMLVKSVDQSILVSVQH